MTAKAAWQRGFRTLARHPWLALIPLTWDLLQMGIAYLGIPLGPIADITRMLDHDYYWWFPSGPPGPLGQLGGVTFTAFLPGFLPSVGSLKVPVQPDSLAAPATLPLWAVLASLLLVPALDALFKGVFLGLLAMGEPLNLKSGFRRATQALPGLLILSLATRLGLMLLPTPLLVVLTAVAWLFFPLTPLALGARGLPLPHALADAPVQLSNRLGSWFGLALRTGLTTGAFTLLWTIAGRPAWVALLVYPFLSTALVGAAVALYVEAPADDVPPQTNRAWLWTLPLAGAATFAATLIVSQWAGFRATREANFPGPFPPSVVYTLPEGSDEWIIYRGPNKETGVARLARNRFGWKLLWKEEQVDMPSRGEPAIVRISWTPEGRTILWGEVYDDRVAYLEADGQRIPVSGPVFLIPTSGPLDSRGVTNLLDAQGRPLEVKQP